MTLSSKKSTGSSRTTRSLKKNDKSFDPSARKKKAPLSAKRSEGGERRHRERRAPVKGETRDSLGELARHQADELKSKNGQIKSWEDKERLAEEQVFIRTKAMDSATDGIFIVDATKNNFPIIYSNQAFQTMAGFLKREVLGQNYFLFCAATSDPRISKEIKDTLRKGSSFQGEMLNFREDGEKIWNYLRISPVHDASGVVTHYVGIQTDMTAMNQRDLAIKEQREELLHVTRVGKLAEFVSSLAHEISQPLAAILSYAQAAARMLGDREPEIKEILQYIVHDDQRASEVIRRLRSLLKKIEPEFQAVDINTIINETVGLIATDVTVRHKVIKLKLAPDIPSINGDRIQLQQVLLNLISNSLDAMEKSEMARELSIGTFLKNAHTLVVEVKDSGCGIPADNMKRIFKHFFTNKPDGLGMGLSISRSIIEMHGGSLDVKNNADGGAMFYFTLPVGEKEDL